MKILEYTGINQSRCKTQYKKIVAAIERDDFKTAEVKKLATWCACDVLPMIERVSSAFIFLAKCLILTKGQMKKNLTGTR